MMIRVRVPNVVLCIALYPFFGSSSPSAPLQQHLRTDRGCERERERERGTPLVRFPVLIHSMLMVEVLMMV
uniref:Putative secreted protein n=1 Tax=Anopheles triannulatus TaxID=58253 RepID=A0A2M4B706_9DIPT